MDFVSVHLVISEILFSYNIYIVSKNIFCFVFKILIFAWNKPEKFYFIFLDPWWSKSVKDPFTAEDLFPLCTGWGFAWDFLFCFYFCFVSFCFSCFQSLPFDMFIKGNFCISVQKVCYRLKITTFLIISLTLKLLPGLNLFMKDFTSSLFRVWSKGRDVFFLHCVFICNDAIWLMSLMA